MKNHWTIFNATNYVCMTFILFMCDSVLCTYICLYIFKQHGFMCIISSAAEMLSKLCICTAGIMEEPFKDFTTQILSAFAQLHTQL